MDYNIKLKNGQVLHGFIKSPGDNLRALLILVHGLGEHTGRYTHWAEMFNNEGIAFTAMDLPGHGRSEGRRGDIKNYSVTAGMLDIILDGCKKAYMGVPVFLYGHSLGGGIVLNYLIRNKPEINGAIVTSPWLKLSFEPPRSKIALAGIMKNVLPGLTQSSGLVVNHISHQVEVIEKYKADPMVHDRISVGLFYSAMSEGLYSIAHASELKVPILLLHGSDDQICSPEGSKQFAVATEKAELKIWEGGYHELHNESFGNDVFDLEMKWIIGTLAKTPIV